MGVCWLLAHLFLWGCSKVTLWRGEGEDVLIVLVWGIYLDYFSFF